MPSSELPRSGVRRPRLEHLTGHVQRHPLRMLAALFTLLAGAALVLRAALSHAPTRTIPLVGRPYATDRAGDPPPADVLFNFVPGPAPSREHDLLSWGHLGDDGNVYPPLYVPALNLAPRVRGGIMILADLPLPPTVQLSLDALTAHVVKTLRSVEGRFNRWWAYPIIIVHHIDLDDGFRRAIRGTTRSEIRFVRIPESDWQPPSGVSQADVQQAYDKLAGVSFGTSASFRSISRYMAYGVYQHPLLRDLDYIWRVTPGLEFYCDIDYDPMAMMALNNKKYAFVFSVHEDHRTVEGLWPTVRDFFHRRPDLLSDRSAAAFLTMSRPAARAEATADAEPEARGAGLSGDWNNCFFSSHSEIADARVLRSAAYGAYFAAIEAAGGQWTARWSEEVVKSLGLATLLEPAQIHWFADMGLVQSAALINCPQDERLQQNGKCRCAAKMSSHNAAFSCVPEWLQLVRTGL